MNLFIDTNIYLSFYHFGNDDLKQLRKLITAIDNKDITLFITQQVKDEFNRNRESKINEALKSIDDQKIDNLHPLFKGYDEFKLLTKALDDYNKYKKEIRQKLNSDIENKKLIADILIKDLFDKAKALELNEEIFAKATRRMDLGNPPGKDKSYGDAINWEILLANAPDSDLFLIAKDKDYCSQLDNNRIKDYLLAEWREKKHSEICLYINLSTFFRDKYPKVELSAEVEEVTAKTVSKTYTFQYLDLNGNGKFDPGEPYWIVNPDPETVSVPPPAGVL